MLISACVACQAVVGVVVGMRSKLGQIRDFPALSSTFSGYANHFSTPSLLHPAPCTLHLWPLVLVLSLALFLSVGC